MIKKINDKKDIIWAGAIGDSIGYKIEFDSYDRIREKYGSKGLTLDKIKGETLVISDDTQMTLFSLEALHKLNFKNFENSIEIYKDAYHDWLLTQIDNEYGLSLIKGRKNSISEMNQFGTLRHRRAPGNTCMSALAYNIALDSKGCGTIMRAAPFGFIENFENAVNEACKQASITHSHPDAIISAGYFAGLINLLIFNKITLEEAMTICNNHFKNDIDFIKMINEKLTIAINSSTIFTGKKLNNNQCISKIGQGWVADEALIIAIYAVIMSNSKFEKAIQIAINHDGDSDSTGSLAAQLFVACYGFPEEYSYLMQHLDAGDAIEYSMKYL